MTQKRQRQYELGLMDTAMFKYHNVNPKGLITSDCSTRALALALGISYEEALRRQCDKAIAMCVGLTDVALVSDILVSSGFEKVALKAVAKGRKRLNAGDAARMYTEGNDTVLVMQLAGHFTVAKDGKVHDVWNCEKKTVYQMWVSKRGK